MRILLRLGKWSAAVAGAVLLTLYFVRAFDARDQRDLATEHRMRFKSEFREAQEAETGWSEYLRIEEALAHELTAALDAEPRSGGAVDRYTAGSLTSPERLERNWNRSYTMAAPVAQGTAVLLHGLTDSPYSMRSTAAALAAAGFDAVVPRMPGHGFAVGGLTQARWEDWAAATRIAVRHAMSLPAGDGPLVLVGYSNGALLILDYVSHCRARNMRCPDAIVLLSPAIEFSAFAVLARWHSAVSWIPFFEKFAWFSIAPEIDPFKFTSFPKHAAAELERLAARVHRALEAPQALAALPPMIAFQSVVDDTVTAEAVITRLFGRLPQNGSELVVYDINRNSTLLYLLSSPPPPEASELMVAGAPWSFGFTVVRNRSRASFEVEAARLTAGARTPVIEPLALRWPAGVYSLSHISVPFRPDDPVYGDGAQPSPGISGGLVFGAIVPRGERSMLQLPTDYFLRARYNPFAAYQEQHLTEWLRMRLGE